MCIYCIDDVVIFSEINRQINKNIEKMVSLLHQAGLTPELPNSLFLE